MPMEIPSYNGGGRLISFRWRQEEVTYREKDIVAQRFRCVLRVEMRWLERNMQMMEKWNVSPTG